MKGVLSAGRVKSRCCSSSGFSENTDPEPTVWPILSRYPGERAHASRTLLKTAPRRRRRSRDPTEEGVTITCLSFALPQSGSACVTFSGTKRPLTRESAPMPCIKKAARSRRARVSSGTWRSCTCAWPCHIQGPATRKNRFLSPTRALSAATTTAGTYVAANSVNPVTFHLHVGPTRRSWGRAPFVLGQFLLCVVAVGSSGMSAAAAGGSRGGGRRPRKLGVLVVLVDVVAVAGCRDRAGAAVVVVVVVAARRGRRVLSRCSSGQRRQREAQSDG